MFDYGTSILHFDIQVLIIVFLYCTFNLSKIVLYCPFESVSILSKGLCVYLANLSVFTINVWIIWNILMFVVSGSELSPCISSSQLITFGLSFRSDVTIVWRGSV